MGFFDFIGDALGAIATPFTAIIDAGTKLLGLPPVVGDALKMAVGAMTGDLVSLMQGGTQLVKDLAGNPAETEYAPPEDGAYGGAAGWAPETSARTTSHADATSIDAAPATDTPAVDDGDPEERRALETLSASFDALNRDRSFFGLDKVITEKELREALSIIKSVFEKVN